MEHLDPTIHQPIRLGILGMLRPADFVDFRLLRDEVGASDSNLSQHLSTLEQAGIVQVEKSFVGKRARTRVRLTPAGRRKLDSYEAALRALLRLES